jgi:hypothetical protein
MTSQLYRVLVLLGMPVRDLYFGHESKMVWDPNFIAVIRIADVRLERTKMQASQQDGTNPIEGMVTQPISRLLNASPSAPALPVRDSKSNLWYRFLAGQG